MAGERIPLHGRDHRIGGCDPIPPDLGAIRFDQENVGDYLHIETTAAGLGGISGIHLFVDFPVGGSQTSFLMTPADNTISGGGGFFLNGANFSVNLEDSSADISGFPGVFSINNQGALLSLFQVYEDGRIFMNNLRTTAPTPGTGELWNSGGTVMIA